MQRIQSIKGVICLVVLVVVIVALLVNQLNPFVIAGCIGALAIAELVG